MLLIILLTFNNSFPRMLTTIEDEEYVASNGKRFKVRKDIFEISKQAEGIVKELEEYFSKALPTVSEDPESNIDLLLLVTEDVLDTALELKQACGVESISGNYESWCFGYAQVYAEKSAIMKLKTAEQAVKYGLRNKAKSIYRNIITSYVGYAYKSYVKQAEFGLEDLKEQK
jgi:hypothetical protein